MVYSRYKIQLWFTQGILYKLVYSDVYIQNKLIYSQVYFANWFTPRYAIQLGLLPGTQYY